MAAELGKVISGSFGNVVIRQKSNASLEIGQLLTAQTGQGKILLQVFDLHYGSQISQKNLEMISGIKLESDNDLEVIESELRNYTLASLKPLLLSENGETKVCKKLPDFFSGVNEIQVSDRQFLQDPENKLVIGNLRSGSKEIGLPVYLDGKEVLSHHLLIAAQTGKGKSNLMSCLISSAAKEGYAGFLILDPHDEYYGRSKKGLKDSISNLSYYTPNNPPPGAKTLKINVSRLKPEHFRGVVSWSESQEEAVYAFYSRHWSKWIEVLLVGSDEKTESSFHASTLLVVKRKLSNLLSLEVSEGEVLSRGIFDKVSGESTVADMADDLEDSKAVVIDTSTLRGDVEMLVGNVVSGEIFNRYQRHKTNGKLDGKPNVSIVLEEAIRVIGIDALKGGPNVFSRIAREGRKFKIGLTAITQIPSAIPRHILSNLSTKIILGIEVSPERAAIIGSAAQDLSNDDKAIASLDKGEAIVTSTFSKFAVPVKIPLFENLIKKQDRPVYQESYPGLSLE